MKTTRIITGWLALLVLSTLNSQLSTVFAQGTAFTYQGQLQNNGSPASGTYNLTFSLFDTNASGVPIAGPVTNNAVMATNGLFTVLIDFGPGVFTGATNWLEIAVETNGVNAFTTLTPRQQLTPVPYAIYAESASGLSGALSASQLTSIGNTNGTDLDNFFVGQSGNATTSGYYNTAIGDYALYDNTSGSWNTASGFQALFSNTSGWFNTANGDRALLAETLPPEMNWQERLAVVKQFMGRLRGIVPWTPVQSAVMATPEPVSTVTATSPLPVQNERAGL